MCLITCRTQRRLIRLIRDFLRKRWESSRQRKGIRGLLQPTHTNAWAFNTMNWQMSHFNQMAAGLTAVQMAHHYLGHYKKVRVATGRRDERGAPVLRARRQGNGAKRCWPAHGTRWIAASRRKVWSCSTMRLRRMPQRPSWALHSYLPARRFRSSGWSAHLMLLVAATAIGIVGTRNTDSQMRVLQMDRRNLVNWFRASLPAADVRVACPHGR